MTRFFVFMLVAFLSFFALNACSPSTSQENPSAEQTSEQTGDGNTPEEKTPPKPITQDDLTYQVPVQKGAFWPKFRRTAGNSGFTPWIPTTKQEKVWSFETGKGIFSSPVIDKDGVIYFGSANAYFYAITDEGKEKWKVRFGELVDSSALIGEDGTIYVGSGDGHLYALSSKDGKEKWKFIPKGGAFITWFEGNVVMGPNGLLYAGNDDFRMYAIDPKTGTSKWSLKGTDQIWSAAAFDLKGNLFYGSNDLHTRAVNLKKALENPTTVEKDALVWRKKTLGSVVASPLITESGMVVVSSFDGYIYAYKAADGSFLWSIATRDHIYASAAQGPDKTIYVPSGDGTLYAVSEDGKIKWQFDTYDTIRSSPAVDGNGIIYFGSGNGHLYAVKPDGTLHWAFNTTENDRNDLNSSPALGAKAIYIAGEDGKLWSVPYNYCLDNLDKRCKTQIENPKEGSNLLFLSKGGSTQATSDTIEVTNTVAFRLVVKKDKNTVYARINSENWKVTIEPKVDHKISVSADGSFFVITPTTSFAYGTTYKVTVDGDYLIEGTRVGKKVSGGKVGGKVQQTITFATQKKPETKLDLTPTKDKVMVFDMHRLAVPQPTLMPSYNQIGFDFMHVFIGVLKYDKTTGKTLAFAIAARNDENGKIVVDTTGNQRIRFPLVGTYRDGSFVWQTSAFRAEFANVDIPMDVFRLSGTLTNEGKSKEGISVFGITICSDIEFYGTLLNLAGLCNPKTDELVLNGTALLKKFDGVGSKPTDLSTEKLEVTDASKDKEGMFSVALKGTLPSHEISMNLLVLDKTTGQPLPANYAQKTKVTLDKDKKITKVSLMFDDKLKFDKKNVEVWVLYNLFPIAKLTVE